MLDYENEEKTKGIKESKYIFPVLLIAAFIMIGGISYAVWTILHTATNTNVIQTGCFNTTFTENGNAINLADAFPSTDAEGATMTPYTFTIENTCSLTANYNVNLESLQDTDLALSNIKVSIDNETPSLLSDMTSVDTTIKDAIEAKNLKTGTLAAGETKSYALRMWLDEDAPLETSSNKTYKGKIVIDTSATK